MRASARDLLVRIAWPALTIAGALAPVGFDLACWPLGEVVVPRLQLREAA